MTSAKRTCHKARFRNEYEAGKKLKRIRASRGEQQKIPVRYYWHRVCGGFHLTSEPEAR